MTTRDEQRQARGDLVGEVLEARRVAAHVDLQRRAAASPAGMTSSRRRSSRSLVRASCGAVVGIGEDRRHLAVLAQRRGRDGWRRRASSATACCELASCALRGRRRPSGCRRRAGTGRSSRGRRPRSAGRRRRAGSRDVGWLPSSGWPRRSCVTGAAKTSSTSTPAAIESHGRAVTISPQRPKAREGRTCSGFFGRSRFASAPDHDRQDRQRRHDDRADADAPRRCRACRSAGCRSRAGRRSRPSRSGPRRPRRRPTWRPPSPTRRGCCRPPATCSRKRPMIEQRVVDPGAEAEHHRDHGREGGQAERLRPARRAGSGRPSRRSARRRAWRPSPRASGTAASAG